MQKQFLNFLLKKLLNYNFLFTDNYLLNFYNKFKIKYYLRKIKI